MQIKLDHIQFTEVSFKTKTFDTAITSEIQTSLSVNSHFFEDDKRRFDIHFEINLQSKNKNFKLNIKSVAHFALQEDIDTDFQNSPFVKINAPAIAFPYIRTFISNLTLNSGYNPIVLPSVNFTKLDTE